MLEVLIGIGVLLIIAIVLAIFRVQSLLSATSKESPEKARKKWNNYMALGFVGFLVISGILFVWYSFGKFDEYTVPIASEHGVVTNRLFWITMAITCVVFIITHILLFVFPYKFRHKDEQRALFYPDNNKLEVIWTLVPAIVLSLLIFSGWKAWSDITSKSPDDAEVVEITGYQFAWLARYPGQDGELGNYDFRLIDVENQWGMDFTDEASFDDFTPRTIHIPKGKPVLFKIRSRDVLHSVFIPEFRLKQDAVPGMPTRFWFVPTKTTQEMREQTGNPEFDYYIYCAEVCGRGHFSMRMKLVVQEPQEYKEWKAQQEPWLSKNPEYLSKVPDPLKEVALISSGIEQTK